jgi:hypothetical protein
LLGAFMSQNSFQDRIWPAAAAVWWPSLIGRYSAQGGEPTPFQRSALCLAEAAKVDTLQRFDLGGGKGRALFGADAGDDAGRFPVRRNVLGATLSGQGTVDREHDVKFPLPEATPR